MSEARAIHPLRIETLVHHQGIHGARSWFAYGLHSNAGIHAFSASASYARHRVGVERRAEAHCREMEVIPVGKLFEDLLESVTQMDEILRGERAPSREFRVDALRVRDIRLSTGLSQARFARVLDVHVGTLRNWEQGLREPTGPARALLRAIHNDPKHVLSALAH